jgi:hypothetical protein
MKEMLKNKLRWIEKWLWCSWMHKKYRCYPVDFTYWHCALCHPCGEALDELLGTEDQALSKKEIKQLYGRRVFSQEEMKQMDCPLPPEKEK